MILSSWRRSNGRSSRRAISLVEALLAFAILSLLLIPLIGLMVGANEESNDAAAFLELLDELPHQQARAPRQGRWTARDSSGWRELVLTLPGRSEAAAVESVRELEGGRER